VEESVHCLIECDSVAFSWVTEEKHEKPQINKCYCSVTELVYGAQSKCFQTECISLVP